VNGQRRYHDAFAARCRVSVACDHANFTALRQIRKIILYQYDSNHTPAGNYAEGLILGKHFEP
jgi:hypothetical protein